jgi:hypothetical protein
MIAKNNNIGKVGPSSETNHSATLQSDGKIKIVVADSSFKAPKVLWDDSSFLEGMRSSNLDRPLPSLSKRAVYRVRHEILDAEVDSRHMGNQKTKVKPNPMSQYE